MLKIVKYPDVILRTKCEPFSLEQITAPETAMLIRQMIEVAEANRGMGLAGNQVAVMRRVFIMKCKDHDNVMWKAFFNPEILKATGKIKYEEGCLSFGGQKGRKFKIKRKSFVQLKYFDLNGKEQIDNFNGVEAVCVQHEINHLDGITMNDVFNQQQLQKRKSL